MMGTGTSTTCARCGKAVYRSREHARAAAVGVASHNGDRRMRPYFDRACKAWHIASSRMRTY